MKELLDKIFLSPYFESKPLVLLDIGASGGIHEKWKTIAQHAVCICVDADSRDFTTGSSSSPYQKVVRVDKVITAEKKDSCTFYLTKSPYCSSSLRPDLEGVSNWIFAEYFQVEKEVDLPAVTLEQVCNENQISYIDWVKLDSQGTDLRLFNAIPEPVKNKVVVAELEPGIISAYQGEDKLYTVLGTFDKLGFWLSDFKVKGVQRGTNELTAKFGTYRVDHFIRTSPCWGELTFLRETNKLEIRELLVLLAAAIVEFQYGFAIQVCDALIQQGETTVANSARVSIESYLSETHIRVPLKKRIKDFLYRISH